MNRKLYLRMFWFLCCVAMFTTALAQTNAPGVPELPGIGTDSNTIWILAISFVTPFIVAGIKWLAPRVPPVLLPTITPLIGILLGLALQWAGKANLTWFDMAKAGALAVFIRETWDQAAKATGIKPPDA